MEKIACGIQELFGLKGKVALVTGGSRGIGFMIARGLLEAGAKVYITARKAAACEAAAEQLSTFGECVAVPMDVTSGENRAALVVRLAQEEGALHHLTRHLAVELGRRQITVNAIAPGFFPSKMTDHVFAKSLQAVEENCLLGRAGSTEEMAGIAVYLSARAGAYTHGAVIPVDGGTSINHQHARTPWPEQFV